jgi:hypothetical protein
MYCLLMPRQPLKSNFSGLDLIDEETRKNLTDPYHIGVFESIFSNQNSLRQCVNTILLEFDKLEEELQKMKEWENSSKEMRLTDLFEIVYGIPEQKDPFINGEPRPVKFLTSSHRKKNEKSSTPNDWEIEPVSQGNKIDDKYKIRDNDIIINTKGAPKVSLAVWTISDRVAYVPSHQFILLRPRSILKDLNNEMSTNLILQLVRLTLQIILMREYNKAKDLDKDNYQKSKNSFTVRIPALKLKDLESFILKIPSQTHHLDQLNAILETYNTLEKLYGRLFDLEKINGESFTSFNQSKNFLPYR